MNDRIAVWLIKSRVKIAFFTLLIIIALGAGLSQLQFNSSYKIFFDDTNEQLIAHERNEDIYIKSNNILFVFEAFNGTIYTPENLASVEHMTTEAWQLPYSSRVDSLTNYQHTQVIDDDLLVADLVEDAIALTAEQIVRIKAIASSEVALVNRLVSDRHHATGVNVVLNMPDDTMYAQGEATEELVAAARELRKVIEAENPNIKIHLQGLSIVNTAFNESAEHDAMYLFPVLFLLIIFMLFILLRSVWSALVTTIVIILGVVISEGFVGWVGYDLNQINVMAPIIILTLAVCDCVHLLTSYLHHLSLGQTRKQAMTEAMKINLQPVFLTSFTTAIGFLAMNTSEVPPFRELGNFAAFGVMAAFFLSVTILPTLAIWLPMKAKPMDESRVQWSSRLANFTINKRHIILPIVLLFATGIASLTMLNELNDNTVDYFDESTEFRQASEFMEANLTGFDVLHYSLDSGEAGGVNEPEFLSQVESFVQWYRSQPEVVNALSYTDTIKRLSQNMHGDDPDWYEIPKTRELASQYQLLYELSLPYGLDLNNQIDTEKRSMFIAFGIKGVKAKGLIELDKRAQVWLITNTPDIAVPASGISTMFAHVGKKNIDSMLSGSVIAIVLITLTLMLAFRSVKFGLLSLLPNVFPALITFGIWGALVGEVDLGVAVVFSLTLGIVVDDTVHFFSKYIRARQQLGKSAADGVRYAFHTVGKPLLVTTIVLVAGFSILMMSNFTANAKMGVMISATISIALIFDFLLLPALLMMFDKNHELSKKL
ncbi:MAG: putative RND superfamily exporter protein [Crocinitomicaceae bacterium]|jgi:predicted RND superfamily exporter protein